MTRQEFIAAIREWEPRDLAERYLAAEVVTAFPASILNFRKKASVGRRTRPMIAGIGFAIGIQVEG